MSRIQDIEIDESDDDFLGHVRTIGVRAAYAAALAMAKNPQTPAGARVQAARLIADIAGILGGAGDEGADKQMHEMTGDELRRYTAKLEAQAASIRKSQHEQKSARGNTAFD